MKYPSEEDRQAFLKKYPFERFLEETAGRRRSFLGRFLQSLIPPSTALKGALVFASIACLMIAVLWTRQEAPLVLSKGGAHLGYYVSRGDEVRKGKKEMELLSGDLLRFFYSSDKNRYLLLVGVEADGRLSTYFPAGGNESEAITKGEEIYLPGSSAWAPRTSFERFFALFSERPISVKEVGDDLSKVLEQHPPRDIEELSLDADQTTFLLVRRTDK